MKRIILTLVPNGGFDLDSGGLDTHEVLGLLKMANTIKEEELRDMIYDSRVRAQKEAEAKAEELEVETEEVK